MRDEDKQKLAEIEQHLVAEDPKLAAKLSKTNPEPSSAAVFITKMLATYLTGLTVIVAGVSVSSGLLIVFGAVITATFPVEVGWRAWRHRSGSSQSPSPLATTEAGTVD
jgi:hypothetical protein